MPVKAIAWDVDGVLVNSMPAVHQAVCQICRQYQVPPPSLTEFCRTLVFPFELYYPMIGITAEPAQIQQLYHQFAQTDDAPAFPDAVAVVQALAQRGMVHGVVSARPAETVTPTLERHGLAAYMRYAVGGMQRKVDGLREFCQRSRLQPEEVLFIGDLRSDIRDGQLAGVKTAAFLGTYGHRDSFTEYRPDYFLTTHQEILGLV